MFNSVVTMLRFTDCIVPQSGHRNKDGYIRILDAPRSSGGRLVMLHRLEYEKVNGKIPDGFEVNHICKNRECCNVNHLEILSRSEHRTKDNSLRYRDRALKIVDFCRENPTLPQSKVGELFGVSQSAVSSILRRHPLV